MNQITRRWVLIIALGIAGTAIILILSFPQKINQVKNELLPTVWGPTVWMPRLPLVSEHQQTVKVALYFASRSLRGLAIEQREVAKLPQLTDQLREIITHLLHGPQTKDLVATIPDGTSLRGVYMDQDGCAYVDFSPHIRQNHPGGSYAELQTIYSVVNSLTSNLDSIKRVKILVDGRETDTLAGHVNIRYPITSD